MAIIYHLSEAIWNQKELLAYCRDHQVEIFLSNIEDYC